jgi:hypothetical protein
MALHNNTSIFIANALFKERNIVVSVLPFALDDSNPELQLREPNEEPGRT